MAKLFEKNQNGSINASINNSDSNISDGVMKVKRKRRSVKRDSPPQRSSIYRGVTRHRWTGRYEAHLWDKNCWNVSQNKKGRQVYLGAYDDEEVAAHAYDLAALKYWGKDTILNFPLSTYQKELEEMQCLSREEYIGSLRRKSSGFSRGVSKYRGVARHHHNGRWEARIGRVFGNKYLYLGTYATQEEAATAYDIAAIEYRGLNAVTNFDLSRYIKWLKPNHDQDNYNPNSHMINENPNLDTSNNYTDRDSFNSTFFNNLQQSSTKRDPNSDEIALALTQQPRFQKSATSALGLLFQSSKFKEMMEMMTSSSSSSLSSVLPDHDRHDDVDNHHHNNISTNPQLIDMELENPNLLHNHTNFGYDQNSSSFLDGDDDVSIFGDLNSIICPPLFQLDFDL